MALKARGFTLLEMTVVLALIAMMSIIIIEALRFGGRAYTEVMTVDDDEWHLFAAQRFLRAVLESAQPFKPERAEGLAFGLEGSATQLSVSSSRSPLRGPGSLTRYHIFVDADRTRPTRSNLMIRGHVDRDGRAESDPAPDKAEVLVENVSRIEWSYFDAPCNAQAVWRETWKGRRDLPALVRARIVFPPGDARHWPDLVVAPRVTDDFIFSLYSNGTEDHVCEGSS